MSSGCSAIGSIFSSKTRVGRPAARRRRSWTRRVPPALVRAGAIPWDEIQAWLHNEQGARQA